MFLFVNGFQSCQLTLLDEDATLFRKCLNGIEWFGGIEYIGDGDPAICREQFNGSHIDLQFPGDAGCVDNVGYCMGAGKLVGEDFAYSIRPIDIEAFLNIVVA